MYVRLEVVSLPVVKYMYVHFQVDSFVLHVHVLETVYCMHTCTTLIHVCWFMSSGFIMCSGMYFTGDGAYRDEDGHYQITGRVDDVINVKGHRIGTAELESCLV